MHTFEGREIRILHHGDYHGNCQIVNKITNQKIEVSSEDILGYAAEYIRSKRIQELEMMDREDLLK